jgi:hypothetical protein
VVVGGGGLEAAAGLAALEHVNVVDDARADGRLDDVGGLVAEALDDARPRIKAPQRDHLGALDDVDADDGGGVRISGAGAEPGGEADRAVAAVAEVDADDKSHGRDLAWIKATRLEVRYAEIARERA